MSSIGMSFEMAIDMKLIERLEERIEILKDYIKYKHLIKDNSLDFNEKNKIEKLIAMTENVISEFYEKSSGDKDE